MPLQSPYTWDLNTLRYRDTRTGRYVEPSRVFESYQRAVRTTQARLGRLAERWQQNLVTDEQFVGKFRQELKSLHVAGAILANGGLAQMTPQRWGEVGASLRKEFTYLDRFVTKVQAGEIPKDSSRIRSRSRSYTANARLRFWNTVTDRYRESGMVVEAMRKLGPVKTEHCSGCQGAANKWYSLDNLPAIGVFECMWFCQCKILFRRKRGPKLQQDDAQQLEDRILQEAVSADGLPATTLSRREREVLDKIAGLGNVAQADLSQYEARMARVLHEKGLLEKTKEKGRTVYRFKSAGPVPVPQPVPVPEVVPPPVPKPKTVLTRREREVFEKIVTAQSPVLQKDLSQYEARIAKRLVERGELERVNAGGRTSFRLNTTISSSPPKPPSSPGVGPAAPPTPRHTPFPPGGFRTISDAEAWAEKNWPGTTFDLKEMDLRAANEILPEWEHLAGQYPEVASRVDYLGTYETKEKQPFGMYEHERGTDYGWKTNSYAHASVDGRIIAFNAQNYYNDYQKIQGSLIKDVTAGYHPPGTGNVASVMTHEFGHQVDNWLRASSDVLGNVMDPAGRAQIREITAEFKTAMESIEKASRYGQNNAQEAWAESFSAIRYTPENRWSEYTQKHKALLDLLTDTKKWNSWKTAEQYRNLSDADKAAYRSWINRIYKSVGIPEPY